MKESSVTTKGQVTIPVDIRSRLGLKPRDKVVFELLPDGVKLKRAESRILAGYGSIKPRQRPEDFARLREEFETGVAQEALSEDRG